MNRKKSTLVLLLVTFVAAHFTSHYLRGTPEEILWVCHLSNLTLAGAILFASRLWTGISLLILLVGLPLWLMDVFVSGELIYTSPLTHLGGIIIAWITLKETGFQKGSWFYGLLWGLGLQIFCHFTTPRESNVNLSHKIWPGMEAYFPGFLSYALANLIFIAVSLFLTEFLLLKILERRQPG